MADEFLDEYNRELENLTKAIDARRAEIEAKVEELKLLFEERAVATQRKV